MGRGSKQRGLNPSDFINGKGAHSNQSLLSVLPSLIQSVVIVIAMHKARWFDADISPDQFILPIGSGMAKDVRKIDHESMVQYTSDNSVRGQPAKPMKIQFMAPEMDIVN